MQNVYINRKATDLMTTQITRTELDGFVLAVTFANGRTRRWSGFDTWADAETMLERVERMFDALTGERKEYAWRNH